MTVIPCLADGGDHFVHHGGTVSGLGDAGRRTGSVCTGDDGVVNVGAVGDTGGGEHQNVGVHFLDASAHISADDSDGIHMNAEGHAQMAELILKAVREIFRKA